jgi:hypothetical protein
MTMIGAKNFPQQGVVTQTVSLRAFDYPSTKRKLTVCVTGMVN